MVDAKIEILKGVLKSMPKPKERIPINLEEETALKVYNILNDQYKDSPEWMIFSLHVKNMLFDMLNQKTLSDLWVILEDYQAEYETSQANPQMWSK